MAEKNQRRLERLRRLVAMESLLGKGNEMLLFISISDPTCSCFLETVSLFHSNPKHSSIPFSSYDNTKQGNSKENTSPNWYLPSPFTCGTWKPVMSAFRWYVELLD